MHHADKIDQTEAQSPKDSVCYADFKARVGDMLVCPTMLDPVREVSDRALNCIVEEARWYRDDENADAYERVIVKTYRPNMISTSLEFDELLQECIRLNQLKHSNMIHLEGVGCFKSETKLDLRTSFYLVEEFGGLWSLFKMLRSKKLHPTHPHVQFTPADCLRWCINIAEALEYLHSQKVIHRDLKTENIWLTDADVSLCEARIGDLKPHRRNFRKFAHGHVTSPPTLVDQPSVGLLRQFSLARHGTVHQRSVQKMTAMGGVPTVVVPDSSEADSDQSLPSLSPNLPSESRAVGSPRRGLTSMPSFLRSVRVAEPEGLAMKFGDPEVVGAAGSPRGRRNSFLGSPSKDSAEVSSSTGGGTISSRPKEGSGQNVPEREAEHPVGSSLLHPARQKSSELRTDLLRSKYLNEGNSLKKMPQADNTDDGGTSSAPSTSPLAQNDNNATMPEESPQPSKDPLEQTSSSVKNMEKVVSMWQNLQLDIPAGAGGDPGENSGGVKAETIGGALDPKNVQDISSGGGQEASGGSSRARRMSRSSTCNAGGVSITRQRSSGGGEGSDNVSVPSSLLKPSDSYKEVHPHAQNCPPCGATSGASDISLGGSTPEGLPSPVPDPALITEVTLGTFVKEHPAKPHAHSVLLSAGISEEITAHPIKFDEFPLSPPAKPLLSHRSDLTTISENQVKLELHPTTSPDKTGLSVKLSLALSGAENDYSEKSPRLLMKKKTAVVKKVVFRTGVPEGLAPTEDYSLIYAPPEYIKLMNCDTMKQLTPKSDVFSFAKIMYEILTQSLINPAAALGKDGGWHTTSETLHEYATKVAEGYREPVPDKWPDGIKSLVQQCWSQDPSIRPGMAFVVRRLKEMAADEKVLRDLEPPPLPPESPKEPDYEDYIQSPRKMKRSQTGKSGQNVKTDNEDEEEDDDDEEEDEDDEDCDGEPAADAPSLSRLSKSMMSGIMNLSRKSPTMGGVGRNSTPGQSPMGRSSNPAAAAPIGRTSMSGQSSAPVARLSDPGSRPALGTISMSAVRIGPGGRIGGIAAKPAAKKGCCVVS